MSDEERRRAALVACRIEDRETWRAAWERLENAADGLFQSQFVTREELRSACLRLAAAALRLYAETPSEASENSLESSVTKRN
jgi:hypothetical protein